MNERAHSSGWHPAPRPSTGLVLVATAGLMGVSLGAYFAARSWFATLAAAGAAASPGARLPVYVVLAIVPSALASVGFGWSAATQLGVRPAWAGRSAPWSIVLALALAATVAAVAVGGAWCVPIVTVAGLAATAPVGPLATRVLVAWRTLTRYRRRTHGRVRTLRGVVRVEGSEVNAPVSLRTCVACRAEIYATRTGFALATSVGPAEGLEQRSAPVVLATPDAEYDLDLQTAGLYVAERMAIEPVIDSPRLEPVAARARAKHGVRSRVLVAERDVVAGDAVEVLVDVEGTDAQAFAIRVLGARDVFVAATVSGFASFALTLVSGGVSVELLRLVWRAL